MPHRIHKISTANYPDPLVDYSNTEFIMEFQDAATVLQQWRNPHLGRSSREGTVLSIAANSRAAYESIQIRLLSNDLGEAEEIDLIEKLKVYSFMLNRTLPEALELVNLDLLLTIEDIQEFIRKHIELMGIEFGMELRSASSILNQLETITDIEITDEFGRKRRINRNDVLDVIGSVLGNILLRQATLWPVDNIIARPRGRIDLKKTYRTAIMREGSVPPKSIHIDDIKVIDRDRLSLIYFIVDMSQSMGKIVYKQGLTRLDGALLTSLGLFYYFKIMNRRKRREFDSFKMHIIPVNQNPGVISDNKKFENLLLGAEAKGRTRLVHATISAINHVTKNYKNNNYDVQLVYLTDGRPNVPFEGIIPGRSKNDLKDYFKNASSSTPKQAQLCMQQLHQIFHYLKYNKDRKWSISYFLMAATKFMNSDLFDDTKYMLSGITRPILIDPTEIDTLGRKIIQEAIANADQ
ncbi:MAG: hypothetical protein OEZ01_15925 [Candidatus Heimdallarchaeota archaeon]|nr:hypothetical protein [Candidatus Heimdallarchaeota archaeon]MDH5647498.1 hypothetical protein [Candidatus Heimdallarchaeota archaeon]